MRFPGLGTDAEIAKITPEMLESSERHYLVEDGIVIPAGLTIEVDIPYPASYIMHAGRFCARPLQLSAPRPVPPYTIYDPTSEDADKNHVFALSWEYPEGAKRGTIELQLVIRDKLTEAEGVLWTWAPHEFMRFIIPGTDTIAMHISGVMNGEIMTIALPPAFQTTQKRRADQKHLSFAETTNRRVVEESSPRPDDPPAAQAAGGTKYIIRPESAAPPEPYQIGAVAYTFRAPRGTSLLLTVYIADESPDMLYRVRSAAADDDITCEVVTSKLPFWPYRCNFVGTAGTSYTVRAEARHARDSRRVIDYSEPSIVQSESVVTIAPVLPMRLVCIVTRTPTTPTSTDGQITVMVSGGAPPYLYAWSDLPSITQSGTTLIRDNVEAGVYLATVGDSGDFQSRESCVLMVDSTSSLGGGAVIADVQVPPPTRCAGFSETTLQVTLEGTTAGPYTIAAYNINASEPSVTSCADGRLRPASLTNGALNVTVLHGRWVVAVCYGAGPTLITSADPLSVGAVDTQPQNVRLAAVVVQNGTTCNGTVKTPTILQITTLGQQSLVDPLYVVDAATDALASTTQYTANVNGTIVLPLAQARTYVLWLQDGRLCPSKVTTLVADTGAAPCGTCFVNNTSCYGCDGVPNSHETYDVCGVCGGDNSTCVPSCLITASTNPQFAPAQIAACVLAGRRVSGVNPPLITLPVPVPLYVGTIDIEHLLLTDMSYSGGRLAILLGLRARRVALVGVKTINIASCTLTGALFIAGPASSAPDPTLQNVYTVSIQSSDLSATALSTTNAGDAQHLVINLINPAPVANLSAQGHLSVVLIGGGLSSLVLIVTNVSGPLVTFQNDNYQTSVVTNLVIVFGAGALPRGESANVTRAEGIALACAYVKGTVIVTSASFDNVTVTSASDECNGVSGAGVPPGPAPMLELNGTAWQFLWGSTVLAGAAAVVVMLIIMFAR
jgi:hypothetical protein